MIQLNLHVLPETWQGWIDIEVCVANPNNPTVPVGTLTFTPDQWIAFLNALLRGADHRDSYLNISLQADDRVVDLSNAVVKIPWSRSDDPWMYRSADLSPYGESQRSIKKKSRRKALS